MADAAEESEAEDLDQDLSAPLPTTQSLPNPESIENRFNFKLQGSPIRTLIGASVAASAGLSISALFGPTANALVLAPGFQLNPLQLGFLVAIPSALGTVLRCEILHISADHSFRSPGNSTYLNFSCVFDIGLTLSDAVSSSVLLWSGEGRGGRCSSSSSLNLLGYSPSSLLLLSSTQVA